MKRAGEGGRRAAVKSRGRSKVAGGVFTVRMSGANEALLHNLAKASGLRPNLFVKAALHHYMYATMKVLGLSFDLARHMTPELMEHLRGRSEALYEARRRGPYGMRDELN